MKNAMERISVSKYYKHFILKGGFLIAAMVGLDTRATMDIDATIKGLPVSEQSVKEMFIDICKIDLQDDVVFSFISIGEIREGDEYGGYRVAFTANYPPMSVPLKLDITTGDKITPKEITYEFRLLLEDRTIKVLSYNLESILSEKLETVISRGDQNTRPRDFYDVYILCKLQSHNINERLLKDAIITTSKKRNSLHIIENYNQILEVIKNSEVMNQRWKNYQKDFNYAKDIEFNDCCNTVVNIMEKVL